MAKLKLIPDPTFKAKVGIPVAGGPDADVEFVFKYRTKDELAEFRKSLDGLNDVDATMAMVSGWELDDAFTPENLSILFQQRIAAPEAIFRTYMHELTGARLGN